MGPWRHRTGDMGRQEGAQKSLAISCLVWRRAGRLIGWTAAQMQAGAGQNARLGRAAGVWEMGEAFSVVLSGL